MGKLSLLIRYWDIVDQVSENRTNRDEHLSTMLYSYRLHTN